MITNAGSGYSKCRGLDVTRWREDPTREAWGQFCYIRDVQRDLVWSAGYQPICRPPQGYEVIFAADKATIRRRDADIETLLEVTVSPEQPRRGSPYHAHQPRLPAARAGDDQLRRGRPGSAPRRPGPPGFRQAVPRDGMGARLRRVALLPPAAIGSRSSQSGPCTSRPWMSRRRAARVVGAGQYETDRSRFLGRGRTPANPAALDHGSVLSGTTGPVLDPVFCLRHRIRLKPGGSAVIALATAVAGSRAEALALADQYREASAASRVFELAWAHSQVEHRHSDRFGEDAHLFQRLASHVIFAGSALRADRAVLAANRLGQEGLWRFGISGDRPIVLARFEGTDQLRLAQELIAAQTYLRAKGLEIDLVFLERGAGRIRGRAAQAASGAWSGPTAVRADRPARRRLRAESGRDAR